MSEFPGVKKLLLRSFFLSSLLLSAAGVQAGSGVTASPPSLDFGEQADGMISAPETVVLTNNSGGSQEIGSVAVSGGSPHLFIVTEDSCTGAILADGASCSIDLIFSPQAEFSTGPGPVTAVLSILFPAAPALTIPLSGNLSIPEITSDVSALNFGNEVAGRLSDPQSITIENVGAADLVIEETKVVGGAPADFGLTMDFCSFQIVGPGESCQISMSMRPTEQGDRTAQLVIQSNDPDQPFFSIDLTGRGTGSGGCAVARPDGSEAARAGWLLFTGGCAVLAAWFRCRVLRVSLKNI